MSRNLVKVGPLEFEAELLTVATEGPYIQASLDLLVEYADEHFNRLEDDGSDILKYHPTTVKGLKAYRLFNAHVNKMSVVLTVDKNGVFESVEQLLDLVKTDLSGFEKIYQAAIKLNPGLKPGGVKVPEEGESNPLA